MSKEYKKLIDDLKGSGKDFVDQGICVEEASHAVASEILDGICLAIDPKMIKKYLKSIGVEDYYGRVVDDIYSSMTQF